MSVNLISYTQNPIETLYTIYRCLESIHGTSIDCLSELHLKSGKPSIKELCNYIELCMESDESPLTHCSFTYQIRNMSFEKSNNYRKYSEEIQFLTINLKDLRYCYLKSRQPNSSKDERELYKEMMYSIMDICPFADFNLTN